MKLKITLTKSPIGSKPQHRKTLQALGLRRMGSNVVREDNAAVHGMIRQCAHLLTVEQIAE
ncbi:MAG: 50S ribosomal protein L30 [Peptococcaceae bacterium]|jgi:large subunit ribosomal protein L30|nr:50S ribosomal protein L30 [Peptococcaceae bacterium]